MLNCDQESLVPTLMGLYFDLYTQKSAQALSSASKYAWNLIEGQKDRVFPASFQFSETKGGSSQRKLFGDMIHRIERKVDSNLEEAKRMCDHGSSKSTKSQEHSASTKDLDTAHKVATSAPKRLWEEDMVGI